MNVFFGPPLVRSCLQCWLLSAATSAFAQFHIVWGDLHDVHFSQAAQRRVQRNVDLIQAWIRPLRSGIGDRHRNASHRARDRSAVADAGGGLDANPAKGG